MPENYSKRPMDVMSEILRNKKQKEADSGVQVKEKLKETFEKIKSPKLKKIVAIVTIAMTGGLFLEGSANETRILDDVENNNQLIANNKISQVFENISENIKGEEIFQKIKQTFKDYQENQELRESNENDKEKEEKPQLNIWQELKEENIVSEDSFDFVKNEIIQLETVANFQAVRAIDFGDAGKFDDLTERFTVSEQKLVACLAQKTDLPFSLLMAQIFKESSFNNEAVGRNADGEKVAVGYAQFNIRYFYDTMMRIGWNKYFGIENREQSWKSKEKQNYEDVARSKVGGLVMQALYLSNLVEQESQKLESLNIDADKETVMKLALKVHRHGSSDQYIKNGKIQTEDLNKDPYIANIMNYKKAIEDVLNKAN